MNKNILSYAVDFASFLLQNLEEKDILDIKEIILFGSAARGKAEKTSDVDIFVNVFREDKLAIKIENQIRDFYKSERCKYWKLISVENPIKCITGRLDKWAELKSSILANGIVLYGKYNSQLAGKSFVIIYWEKVRPESKRVLLSKKIYGYTYNGRTYEGISKYANIQRLGSNCILVPLEAVQIVLKTFRDMNVPMKSIYVSKFE